MASRGSGARQKGANFERKLAKILSEATGLEWKRGLRQSRGGGAEGADVVCDDLDSVHVEAKRHKRSRIKAAMRQAQDDVEGTDKMPVVITKDDRKPILVTLQMDDFLKLFRTWLENENRDLF